MSKNKDKKGIQTRRKRLLRYVKSEQMETDVNLGKLLDYFAQGKGYGYWNLCRNREGFIAERSGLDKEYVSDTLKHLERLRLLEDKKIDHTMVGNQYFYGLSPLGEAVAEGKVRAR